MGKRKQRKAGAQAFREYYETLFKGENQFFDDLAEKRSPVLRFHPARAEQLQALWSANGLTWKQLSWYPYAVQWPQEVAFGEELPGYAEGLFYPMNTSSLIPVLALGAQPGDNILDCCAAPGGKTLAILDSVSTHTSSAADKTSIAMTANDSSAKRRTRLRQLLEEHGYSETNVIGRDAATLFKGLSEEEQFDRILADVPCSSERHVFLDEKHLSEWSPNRVKQLAQRQIAILSGVFEALKPGGRLVYSTCAVNKKENEGVVATLLKKKGDAITLLPWTVECPRLPGLTAADEKPYKVEFPLENVTRIIPHRMEESPWAKAGAEQKQEAQLMDPMFVAVFEKRV